MSQSGWSLKLIESHP